MVTYIISNGAEYSDHTLFFVATEEPIAFVNAVCQLAFCQPRKRCGVVAAAEDLTVYCQGELEVCSLPTVIQHHCLLDVEDLEEHLEVREIPLKLRDSVRAFYLQHGDLL